PWKSRWWKTHSNPQKGLLGPPWLSLLIRHVLFRSLRCLRVSAERGCVNETHVCEPVIPVYDATHAIITHKNYRGVPSSYAHHRAPLWALDLLRVEAGARGRARPPFDFSRANTLLSAIRRRR